MSANNYEPVERCHHSTVKVGDFLYMWGGDQPNLPELHSSEKKKAMTSMMEVYHLPTGRWEQKPTNGDPPLGIIGYSSVAIGNDIFYFGGYCGHSGCFHNSLYSFNVSNFTWKELCLTATNHGPMMKGFCGMIGVRLNGEDYLVVIGGRRSSAINTPLQSGAQYTNDVLSDRRCSEIHYYKVSSGEWLSPVVTGDRPPPIDSFTLTSVTDDTALLFGGDSVNGSSKKLYAFTFTTTSVEVTEVPNLGSSEQWPMGRQSHCSALVTFNSGSYLFVISGYLIRDFWLLDTNTRTWKELVGLPNSVTERWHHSLCVWSVTPTTKWMIVFGGEGDYSDTAVIELTKDNDWFIREIPLDQYQDQLRRRILSDWENLGTEKQLQIFQDCLQLQKQKEFYQEQPQREIKEKEEHSEALSQRLNDVTTLLQEAEKNNASLRNSLELCNKQLEQKNLEDEQLRQELHKQSKNYETLKAKFADNEYILEMLKEKTQVEEKKQIINEDYEKLKLKLADMEEQYVKEKENITDLRAKVSDNELHTAKLMKEKSQLQERVTSLEEQSIKETSSIGLQFNYLIPSMDNLDCLSDVQVAEKKLFLIQGEKPQLINWEKYGLRIGVQEDTLSLTDTVEVAVVALLGGEFVFPKNTVLVSAVYAVLVSKPLLKPLRLEIEHCIDLKGRPGLTQFLKFAIAPVSTPSLPYYFSITEGGEFKADSWYGSIQRKEFCLVAIVGEKLLPKSSTNGDESEEEEEEQAGEETEEEVEDNNSNDSDDTHNSLGVSSGGQGESTSNEGVEEEGETGGQPFHEEGNEEQDNERVEESKDHEEPQHEEATAPIPCTDSSSDFNSNVVVSTGIVENMAYAGLVYYEEKRAEDLVRFAAAKDLSALLEFIKKDCPHAERGQSILFRFKDYHGYIELKFDTPQKKPFTGWSIEPHMDSCKFLRCDVDKFGEANYPLPSICLISVYASPGAVPSLHYSVPLDGVADPKTLFIHRSLRTTPPPPSTVQGTSLSSSTASISQTRRQAEEGTFRSDIAHRVMAECTSLIKNCGIDIYFLVDKLLEHNIINAREKREITDGYTKHTAGERMDELLHIISSSISMEGEVFGIFLDILKEEGTRRTIKLADKLIEKYKSI